MQLVVCRHAAANTIGERPTENWSYNSAPTQTKRKSSKRMQHRWGCVISLSTCFELLVNQQKDGDSSIESIVAGLHEKSREGTSSKWTTTLLWMWVACAEAPTRIRVKKPQFSEAFPAVIREGADRIDLAS